MLGAIPLSCCADGQGKHTVDPVREARRVPVPAERERVSDAHHGIGVAVHDVELVLGGDLEQLCPKLVHGRVVQEELGPRGPDGLVPSLFELRTLGIDHDREVHRSGIAA